MNKRTHNPRWTLFVVAVVLAVAPCILAMGGCASTATGKADPGPGSPDAVQLQHYQMVKAAIEAKSRNDALAAISLFEADMYRWRTNTMSLMSAMAELVPLTEAVDKGDWDLSNKLFAGLKLKYGRN